MANDWKALWQRFSGRDSKITAEVDRIAVLQETASRCRAEYADKKEQAALSDDASLQASLAASRKRMEEAEAAHTAALQKWDNKQTRQKSW